MKSDKEINRMFFNSCCNGLDLIEATPQETHKLGYLNGWNDKHLEVLEKLKEECRVAINNLCVQNKDLSVNEEILKAHKILQEMAGGKFLSA